MIKQVWASKTTGVLSAAVLGAVVLAGTVAVIAGGRGTTSARTVTVSRIVRGSSGCSLPAGSQDPSQVQMSPPAATWAEVGTIFAPQNPAVYGPQHTTSAGWGYCFADNPAGAVLFAINAIAEGTAHTAAQLVAHYSSSSNGVGANSQTLAGYSMTFGGYQLFAYTPRRATVSVVLQVADDGDVEMTPTVVWVPALQDWRLLMPPSGSVPAQAVADGDAGYVEWVAP